MQFDWTNLTTKDLGIQRGDIGTALRVGDRSKSLASPRIIEENLFLFERRKLIANLVDIEIPGHIVSKSFL